MQMPSVSSVLIRQPGICQNFPPADKNVAIGNLCLLLLPSVVARYWETVAQHCSSEVSVSC